MTNYLTTTQLLETPWSTEYTLGDHNPLPQWDYTNPIKFNDVLLWEEIFYQPGHIGVYTSYQPYAEFYIIVYDLFKTNINTIETFFGKSASDRAASRAKELGVDLEKKALFVDPLNVWMYD